MVNMNNFLGSLSILVLLAIVNFNLINPQVIADTSYSRLLRLQPEIDQINVTAYLKNERLVKLQLKCVLLDGPCDIVGRWLKPRVKAALLGECLVCTKSQQQNFDKWLQVLIEKFPDFYRAAVAKYILNSGIDVSDKDKLLVNQTLTDEAIDKAVSELKSVSPRPMGKDSNNINMQ